jgi:DNA-binding winged helix-turn-helix (wHTH) protein
MNTQIDQQSDVWIDDGGLLHSGNAWVALPDVEWRLMTPLVERIGQLVSREDLTAAGWPDREIGATALNGRIKQARRRLEPLGLTITTVRGRGYVLARIR